MAVAFTITHLTLIYLSLGPAKVGANDVGLYAWWVGQGDRSSDWPGISDDWVYPVGALAPLVLAAVFGTSMPTENDPAGLAGVLTMPPTYLLTWCVMITLINLVTTVVVARRFGLPSASAPLIGWFVFLMLLGPCAIARLDAVMMPLALIALVAAAARPALASVLLTCSAWVKVSGGAALIPLFAIGRSWRDRIVRVVAPAALTCLVVVLLQWAAGGQWRFLTSFIHAEAGRGLQIEAVLATPVVLSHAAHGEQSWVWNDGLSTYETWGAGAELAIRVSDGAMALMALAVGLLTWLARNRAGAALLVGTLATMTGLIVTHKVGSPQFIAWLAPAAVAALCAGHRLRFWLPVSFALLVTAALTGMLYPWGYSAFLSGDRAMLTVWTIRNLLLVAVFAATLAELVRLWRADPPPKATLRRIQLRPNRGGVAGPIEHNHLPRDRREPQNDAANHGEHTEDHALVPSREQAQAQQRSAHDERAEDDPRDHLGQADPDI
ncbi:MAG: hypothetical protein LBU05_03590 [Bifidobacteriaceae bacterium]|nr:hypothetical protein [Bifidobacteriaceae bacterium]